MTQVSSSAGWKRQVQARQTSSLETYRKKITFAGTVFESNFSKARKIRVGRGL
jgi:hypothetical protein